jgi:hypothetical protein
MTAQSLRILERPADASPTNLEHYALDAAVAQGLSLYATMCGPYELAAWSESRGHALHYVDNCWVRADVNGRDVVAFFAEVLKSEVQPSARIDPDRRYLIEAEEY